MYGEREAAIAFHWAEWRQMHWPSLEGARELVEAANRANAACSAVQNEKARTAATRMHEPR